MFKHMKGRNGPTSFLPIQRNGGIQKEMSNQCLMAEQTKQIYDKIEIGEMVKIRKMDKQNVQNTPKQVTLVRRAQTHMKRYY